MTIKKLTDLRPCDACGGPIRLSFFIVRVSLALVKPQAVHEFFGMHQFFGGKANNALVENFAPAARDAVIIAGDREPELMTEILICHDCYLKGALDLPLISERVNARKEAAAGDAAADRLAGEATS